MSIYIIQEYEADQIQGHWLNSFVYGLFETKAEAENKIQKLKNEFDWPEENIFNQYRIKEMTEQQIAEFDSIDLASVTVA